MALEDAVVFGTLFSHLSSWDQVSTFLNAYQEIRQGRTTAVNEMDVSNAAFVRLPPGPAQEARDVQIRQARDEWDDGSLKQEFEGLAQLFCYEAEDAAQVCLALRLRTFPGADLQQEWWVTWGRYHAGSDNPNVQFDYQEVKQNGC